jgi:hypothetical protein
VGITFLHWSLYRHFFAPAHFPEHFSEILKKIEVILFLDLGNQFETLSIIVIFCTLVAASSLLVACVSRRDLVIVLGSRL